VQRKNGGLIGKQEEIIPLNSLTRIVFLNLKERQRSDYVFPNKVGGRLEATAYNHHLYRIRENSGLPDSFRPMHGLRHTFASNLANSGKVDMYTLQKLLTHKEFRMIQRYAHLHDDTLKKASEIMDTLSKKRK